MADVTGGIQLKCLAVLHRSHQSYCPHQCDCFEQDDCRNIMHNVRIAQGKYEGRLRKIVVSFTLGEPVHESAVVVQLRGTKLS